MKLSSALPILALAALALVAWVPTRMVEDDKTLAAAEIASVLKDLKLEVEEAKDDEEKTYWTITAPGDKELVMYQYGGTGDVASSVSLSTVYEVEASLEAINGWNQAERFTKAYQADEDMVFLEDDLDMSVAPSKAVLKKFVENFLKAMPDFEEAIK